MFPYEHVLAPALMPDFLTTAETADLLGFTVQHVRRLVRNGQLQGSKMGRDWVIFRESVDAFVADRENLDLSLEPTADT